MSRSAVPPGPTPAFAVVSTDVGERYAIALASSQVRWTEMGARAAVTAGLADPSSRDDLRDLAAQLGLRSDDDEQVVRALAAALVDGAIVAFESIPAPRGRPITRSDRPTQPPEKPTPGLTEAWISFELLDDTGAPLGDRSITFEYEDGRLGAARLDGGGRSARISVRAGESIHLEWPERLDTVEGTMRRDGLLPRPDDILITRAPVGTTRLGPNRHWRIIVTTPRATCVRLVGMLFELNKSFLLPAATEGIRLLSHMYRTMPDAQILAVGHTDRTGKKFRNDSLSLERARAVVAYAKDDVEAWLANYDTGMDASRRWGKGEDLLMLSCLPRGGVPYYSALHSDHSLAAAVLRLQEAHGLVADGELGPASRRALIAEYMALDGTSLPAQTTMVAHGCGEHFPRVPTEDEVEQIENRRVELFFFPTGITPSPSGVSSAAGTTEYPKWLEAVVEERTFTPSAAGHGRVYAVTDYDPVFAALRGLMVELRSTDGVYTRMIDALDATLHASGTLAFEFNGVPIGCALTLAGRTADGEAHVLFEDVPFLQLSTLAPGGAPVGPFVVDDAAPRSWWEEWLERPEEIEWSEDS